MSDQRDRDPRIIEQDVQDRQQIREERKQLVAIGSGELAEVGRKQAFLPTSLGEAMQLGAMIANSNMVPPALRGKSGDCTAIVMQAMRWGMDPFMVAQKTYFVKEGAPPGYESQLIMAVINSSGALIGRLRCSYEGTGIGLRCNVSGVLRADPTDVKYTSQSFARVKVKNSPLWEAHPEQQLWYYTARAWCRAHAPEVLLGVYSPDEVEQFQVRLPDGKLAEQPSSGIPQPTGVSKDAPPRPTRNGGGNRQQDQRPEQQQTHVDNSMPSTPAAWGEWRAQFLEMLDACIEVEAVNALVTEHKARIDASMFTDDVMGEVTNKIGDLMMGGE